jgi:hypothetical protein
MFCGMTQFGTSSANTTVDGLLADLLQDVRFLHVCRNYMEYALLQVLYAYLITFLT